MATYVFDRETGRMVDKVTREPMNDPREDWRPTTPQVFGDLPGYQSPIDGSWVEGRRARRYDLEKNDCVDANELSSGPKRFKNRKFIEKRGLQGLAAEGVYEK